MKLYGIISNRFIYRFIFKVPFGAVSMVQFYDDQFHKYWALFVHYIHKICPAAILQSFPQNSTRSTGASWAGKKKYGYNCTWQSKAFAYCESVYL